MPIDNQPEEIETMAKAKKSDEQEQKTGDVAAIGESAADKVLLGDEQLMKAAREALDAEQAVASIESVSKASLDGPVPAPTVNVEKLVGSEAHGIPLDSAASDTSTATAPAADPGPTEFTAAEVAEAQALVDAGGGSIELPEVDNRDLRQLMAETSAPAPAAPATNRGPWDPTHRVVTADSVHPVMVVELGEREGEKSYGWTWGEHKDGACAAPALQRVDGQWTVYGVPFAGNVHELEE